jgi:3'(2'), 5'-bisphosphate nucleotidase
MLKNISLDFVVGLALEAGKKVMEIYQRDFQISYKKDSSPLTEADLMANKIICDGLNAYDKTLPILSEEIENVSYAKRKDWDYYWCIDPIDGTKEFIEKNGQFTINIALIYKSTPVLGVVFAPAFNLLYAAKKEEGAYKQELINNQLSKKVFLPLHVKDSMVVAVSKTHRSPLTDRFIDRLKNFYPNLKIDSRGSSLKLCMVAEGSVKTYPRVAPTMEWDTAAAHAILLESGKGIYYFDSTIDPLLYLKKDLNLTPIAYNKPDLHNPSFIAI